MRKIAYSALFVVIALFLAECQCAPVLHEDGAWVVCRELQAGGPSQPRLVAYNAFSNFGTPISGSTTQINDISGAVEDFNPEDYECPTDPNSPPRPKSSKAIYPVKNPFPLPAEQAKGTNHHRADFLPVTNVGSYLRKYVLNLPFEPLGPQISNVGSCDPSQPDVLQVSQLTAKVVRMSTCPLKEITAIPTVTNPLQVEITPDGQTALVTSFDNAVNFIDLNSNRVTYTLKTDASVHPDGIAITPDGTRAYITSFSPSNPVVEVIDLASKNITATIPVTSYPQGAFMTPDGSQVYITFPLGGAVYIIDTMTNTVATTLGIASPYGVAFNSTGTRAYITSGSGSPGTVQVVDTTAFKVMGSYTVGTGPVDVAVLYGDRFVVVINNTDGSTSLIDISTGKVTTSNIPGGSPVGLAVVR